MDKTTSFLYTREDIKERIKKVKNIPLKNLRTKILFLHPEYDTKQGKTLINNVLNLKSTDLRLCEILEKIAQMRNIKTQ